MKKIGKYGFIPVFLLWQTACLSAQICGIWPGGEIPRETMQVSEKNIQQDLLNCFPMISFFQEKVKFNGQELQLSLSLVPDQTLEKAKDLFAEKFPRSSRYYTGSTLQVTLPQQQNSGSRELSLIHLNGIPELILFTREQLVPASSSPFRIPEDFKKQYWIPENAADFVFVEYPMRNARLLSFQIPEKDSIKIFQQIHAHLLARQWQAGKQEKLMTDAVLPGNDKKENNKVTAASPGNKNPLAPVYYQEQDQKLLLLFYRTDNKICRFSYYERPLQN